MSLPVIAEPLPTTYTFGKVVGRVIHLIADTAEDTDDKPQARAAAGRVIFAPKEVLRKTVEADYPAIVLHATETATLSNSGRVLDAEGRQGIWLAVGIYTVTFEITGAARAIPSFEISVTAAHNDATPLDLAKEVPYVAPVGVVVQTLVIPSGGTTGQVLVRTANGGLEWAAQSGSGAGAITSVNGKTGVVVLNAADVGAATTTALSDGLATKVNTSTYTAGIALKANTADLAAVAQTGSYNDLANKPTIPAAPASDAAAGVASLRTLGTGATQAKPGNYTPTKTDVGLGNVDNTADTAKPVSTAQQTALDAKQAAGNYMQHIGTSASPISVASTARPAGTGPVYWMCTAGVTPTNAIAGDIVWNAT